MKFSSQKRVVFTTTRTVYMVQGDRCVSVLDRENGRVRSDNPLVGARVACAMRRIASGDFVPVTGELALGDRLYFANHVLTSAITDIREEDVTAA